MHHVLRALVLAMGACFTCVGAQPIVLSVKLVKTSASKTSASPVLQFFGTTGEWHRIDRPFFSGENPWEIFFEIETLLSKPPLVEAKIIAPGVKAARIIVGRTDVPFHQVGDKITFTLVDDRSKGQLMQVDYQSPRGGLPIHFIHDWKMRSAGPWLREPYPEKQIAAIPNYLVAVQEALRRMGFDGKPSHRYLGEIVLMGSENAVTRGHLDYPPHFHIMYYEFDPVPHTAQLWRLDENPYGVEHWYSRLAPHFYMDGEGRVRQNTYSVLTDDRPSVDLGPGEPCHLMDSKGNTVLDITIAQGGLTLFRKNEEAYSIRPDPKVGAWRAVIGYRQQTPVFRVESMDDPARGFFRYQIESMQGDDKTFTDFYQYDPFTAKIQSQHPEHPSDSVVQRPGQKEESTTSR